MMICRDIFMRHTGVDGGSYVQCHRVWDAQRFIAARQADAAKQNADASKNGKTGKAAAQQITEEQYLAERG